MSNILRIELISLAVLFFVIVVRNVNKKNLQLKYSLIWIVAAVVLIIMAFFPNLVFAINHKVGIETPANLIFLLSNVWLIGMNFSLTVIVSRQSEKIKKLIQTVSIDNYERQEKDAKTEGKGKQQ